MDTRSSQLALDLISEYLERRTGLLLGGERRAQLEANVANLCREHRVGPEQLFTLLRDGSEHGRKVFGELVQEATVNHTAFFREMKVFSHLDRVIDRLAEEPEVRVWSAASATGEELYTTVMVLAERLGFTAVQERWRFLGTDINPAVVSHAERGVYNPDRVDGVPADLRERYFDTVSDGRYRVCSAVRSLCTFRTLNLIQAPYPFQRRFHLVFCRHVLYYFGAETQARVLRSIHAATDPAGALVTGVSETIEELDVPWVRQEMCLYSHASRRRKSA
jgi:chemotaxis protein methyltransferase CheR